MAGSSEASARPTRRRWSTSTTPATRRAESTSGQPLFGPFEQVAEWLEELRPDRLVVIYNDHMDEFFLTRTRRSRSASPTSTRSPTRASARGRSRRCRATRSSAGTSRARSSPTSSTSRICQELEVDHGVISPLPMVDFAEGEGGWKIPIVPLAVNVILHPLPTPLRCWKLGPGAAPRDPLLPGGPERGRGRHRRASRTSSPARASARSTQDWDQEFMRLLAEEPETLTRLHARAADQARRHRVGRGRELARDARRAARSTRSRSSRPTTRTGSWATACRRSRWRRDATSSTGCSTARSTSTSTRTRRRSRGGWTPPRPRSAAADAGMRAIVVKSHHHDTSTDVLALREHGIDAAGIDVFGGIALNTPGRRAQPARRQPVPRDGRPRRLVPDDRARRSTSSTTASTRS